MVVLKKRGAELKTLQGRALRLQVKKKNSSDEKGGKLPTPRSTAGEERGEPRVRRPKRRRRKRQGGDFFKKQRGDRDRKSASRGEDP